jgi:hypothetical protein
VRDPICLHPKNMIAAGSLDLINPEDLDVQLSQRLRHCALICELDLDEELHARLTAGMERLKEQGVTNSKRLLRRFAALVSTYLVAEGIFNFAQGTFFPNLSVRGLDRNTLTDVFEYALREYKLEQFRVLIEGGALRYLTPILAHGGIPKYSLPDFFKLLADTERRGASDASEMLAYWREHPSVFANKDRAVERFLLYGGDLSYDFLDRCLDLVFAHPSTEADLPADRFALPRYVCESFLELKPEERNWRKGRGTLGDGTVPRPFVLIDPWDASGPMLVLPSVTGMYLDGSWDVVAQDNSVRHRASRMERVVPLAPARRWSVEFRSNNELGIRTFTFSGLARGGVLLFDYNDRKLVSDFSRLRDNRVWILHSDNVSGSLYRQSGERLKPVETAPNPTATWSGYSLQAFDLVDSERIRVGAPVTVDNQETEGSSFWVRIRGDRIALHASALPGIRTTEGLSVYSDIPLLSLPGFHFDATQNSTAWSARVVVDGCEHEFDTAALARNGDEAIRAVVPKEKVSKVHVTARGPLGMDLRTEFCVVPSLSVQRPSSILLPSEKPGAVLGYVDASWRYGEDVRVPIRTSEDTIEISLTDFDRGTVNLLVTIPCLHWTVVANAGSRSELGQRSAKITSTELFAGDARLVVRTRQPGVYLELKLKEGANVLQVISARTGGEDGRWAFDLRPLSDSVKRSTAVRLDLALGIGPYDVGVGYVQAELDIQKLTVHQRIGNGDCTVVLDWDQGRKLDDRVVRLWSLSTPWRQPITEPLTDGGACQVAITRSQDDLPPGFYLAEVTIDDGWTTPRRPSSNAGSTRQFRLDTEEHHADWLDSLDLTEPEYVLTYAAATGKIVRQLTDHECERIVPFALEALELVSSLQYPTVDADAVADLIAMNPASLIAGIRTTALTWSASHSTPFLGSIFLLLSAMRRSVNLQNSFGDTSTLWEICPPIAAMHDLPNLANESTRERFEAGSGSRVSEVRKLQLIPEMRGRVPELQRLIARSADGLEALRRESFLLPKLILDLDTQAAAQLEWLIADKGETFSAEEWVRANRKLGNKAEDLDSRLFSEFASICAPAALASSIPALCFPETVYVAALHVVCSTKSRHRAAMALHELITPCPIIVSRSLILAAAHSYLPTETNESS